MITALNDTTHRNGPYMIQITNNDKTMKMTYCLSNIDAALVSPFADGDDGMQLLYATNFTAAAATVTFRY